MTHENSTTGAPSLTGKAQAKAARLAREAAALRANLRKRKDQARAQAADGPAEAEVSVGDSASPRLTPGA